MTRPLDFTDQRDRETRSWQRATEETALVEQIAWDRWLVTLSDGEESHQVRLWTEAGEYLGKCDCPGYEYHSGPCAHLCIVRRLSVVEQEDIRGRPVRIPAVESVVGDPSHEIDKARADGGEL